MLTGCGDQPAQSSSPTPATPAKPTATDEAKAAVTKAATEVSTEVKKQVQAAYADLSQQLMACGKLSLIKSESFRFSKDFAVFLQIN